MISGDDLEAFGYWDMVDAYPEKPKSVMEMVTEYNNTAENEKDSSLYWELTNEEYDEWFGELPCNKTYSNPYDPTKELKELSDLVYVIYGYAWSKGWDLDEAVRRVHENNMGRMYQPDGTIKRRKDGKILRNKDFPEVDLSDLV